MLKCNLGLINIEGPRAVILAEFSTLVKSMTEEFPKEVIIKAFEDGLNGPSHKCDKCSNDSESEDDNPDIIGLVLDSILEGLKKAADNNKKEE